MPMAMRLVLVAVGAVLATVGASTVGHIHCRDPDLGAHHYAHGVNRTFLMISGAGAGIGNFLLFYPAAYFFAVLTGRNIIVQDKSLIGEMCHVINCGFPHASAVSRAFPSSLSEHDLATVRGIKAWDFSRHLNGEAVVTNSVLRADGYKYQSGWYLGHNFSEYCISKLTGCPSNDVSCHDRHALQQLVRGPFKEKFNPQNSAIRVVGAPHNLIEGVLTLPHSMAPRLDAAVHLRCQFSNFEYLVGPEDSLWANYVKEVDDWLGSTSQTMGMELFKVIESKIMSEMATIVALRIERRRRLLATITESMPQINATEVEHAIEASTFSGAASDHRIFVYLASDNERVKEAFATYLVGHANISVMRVLETGHTVHAKNIDYLKQMEGVFPLTMDWYALSLANNVFAYRRDTHLLSTFAQSAQRVSGNTVSVNEPDGSLDSPGEHSRGFQLQFDRSNRVHWAEF